MDFDLNEPVGDDSAFDKDFWDWSIHKHKVHNLGLENLEGGSPLKQPKLVNLNSDATGDELDISDGDAQCPPHHYGDFSDSASSNKDLDEEYENVGGCIELDIENRLAPGSVLDSMDQAYLLYCEYGRLTGFSVKKGSQKYGHGNLEVRMKFFFCSCHGKSNARKFEYRLHAYKKQDNRCMCRARLTITLDKQGTWIVSNFVKEHNHELADKQNSYLLRSARQLTHAKKSLLEALASAGIKTSTACRFMEKESGGPQNTGFTRKDAYHHMDRVRKKSKLEDADSDALMQYFKEKSRKEPFFFWDIQKDEDGRLLNFFFRDYRSLTDYEFFGDVLSVDTTYRTNKYDLICAPFVGVNHHMKNCLFGIAFLSDETTETFEWLFSTFSEAMNAKEPKVVFTDQCQAMMNAIDSQWKSSHHRLCQWHINQNAPSQFGKLNGDYVFKSKWFHCMNGCETEDEFETLWKQIIADYSLLDNRWFRGMYKLRRRWATVFSHDIFCAGLHATSRSELTNKVLKALASASGSLYNFVMQYEQVQLDWRRTEGQDDTFGLGDPGLLVQENPLIKQAANFFTRSVFLSYEYEATYSINVNIADATNLDDSNEVSFKVISIDKPARTRCVVFNKITHEASCTCRMWETSGVLCRHIFRILYHHNIMAIPDKYLIFRLSKEAKRRCPDDMIRVEHTSKRPVLGEDVALASYLMREMYDLVYGVEMDRNGRARLLSGFEKLRDEIRLSWQSLNKGNGLANGSNTGNASEVRTCRDPVVPVKRRFSKIRVAKHWERPKRKEKRKTGTSALGGCLICFIHIQVC